MRRFTRSISLVAFAAAALFIASRSHAAVSVLCATGANKVLDASNTLTGGGSKWWYTSQAVSGPDFAAIDAFSGTGVWWAQVVGNGWVAPGTACGGSTLVVVMSPGDYNAMIAASAVTETLSIGLVVLFLFMGLGLGYYVFSPRQRSIVDISS